MSMRNLTGKDGKTCGYRVLHRAISQNQTKVSEPYHCTLSTYQLPSYHNSPQHSDVGLKDRHHDVIVQPHIRQDSSHSCIKFLSFVQKLSKGTREIYQMLHSGFAVLKHTRKRPTLKIIQLLGIQCAVCGISNLGQGCWSLIEDNQLEGQPKGLTLTTRVSSASMSVRENLEENKKPDKVNQFQLHFILIYLYLFLLYYFIIIILMRFFLCSF